jgi:Fe-Mn family superoxide dismutase
MKRRLILLTLFISAGILIFFIFFSQAQEGPFLLEGLPYGKDALEPVISSKTLSFHYDKHHRGYLHKLNELVSGTELADLTLEDIMKKTSGVAEQENIFNNAAQVWNHTFYWKSLSPNGGGRPLGNIADRINKDFGSYEDFINQFCEIGTAQFGSGWVWLVENECVLSIIRTSNAENPISQNQGKPVFVIDVWEHAYYLDYQNRRKDHIRIIMEKLINWAFAEKNLTSFVLSEGNK